ncbi:hypothetical protein niasHT_021906 [Heterodera trifolii]|uniref:Uncharacterized protein n=1 Tax=Heterodera trifolii TaxID=157864 RepID=A0ABD2KCH9_9BILA
MNLNSRAQMPSREQGQRLISAFNFDGPESLRMMRLCREAKWRPFFAQIDAYFGSLSPRPEQRQKVHRIGAVTKTKNGWKKQCGGRKAKNGAN